MFQLCVECLEIEAAKNRSFDVASEEEGEVRRAGGNAS